MARLSPGLVLFCTSVLIALSAGTARAQPQYPTPAPPVTLDGPSGAIQQLDDMSIARDGSGGLVYLKQVGGIAHVFFSSLTGGAFQAPTQLDGSLAGASSQPVVAAGNDGVLLVAFINGGVLYVVDRAAGAAAFGAPRALIGGAASPAISMSNFGKGYLAFAAVDGSGFDVRAAYYNAGRWALESTPLNAISAGDNAGANAGRPAVVCAGDGVGIVVWGEGGHVYTRRMWGTSPSVVDEQADIPSLAGWSEVTAGDPVVGAGGDSSYATVAFQELFAAGSVRQSRVLMNRLHGSRYDGVTQPDGLRPGAEGATDPQLAVTEYGEGLVTSEHDLSDQVFADQLQQNDSSGLVGRVDSLPDSSAPDPVPGVAGLLSVVLAWQHDSGAFGSTEIRAEYYNTSAGFGPEMVLSSPNLGRTNAGAGLVAGGDVAGDAAVAWVQGSGAGTRIVTDQLYKPPGSFSVLEKFAYARSSQPVLSWSAPQSLWGQLLYTVTVDGTQVGQTSATSFQVPAPLTDGPHAWRVTAADPAGLQSSMAPATVFVDTFPPAVGVRLSGRGRVGSPIHISVSYTDTEPGEPAQDASGVSSVLVRWGDGSSATVKHGKFHVYRRAGRYTVTVIVTDKAGNTTRVAEQLRIAPSRSSAHRHG